MFHEYTIMDGPRGELLSLAWHEDDETVAYTRSPLYGRPIHEHISYEQAAKLLDAANRAFPVMTITEWS